MIGLGLGGLAIVVAGGWLARLDVRVQTYLAGPALGTTRIMAAPKVLRVGAPVDRARVVAILNRLGYIATETRTLSAGELKLVDGGLDLHQRPASVAWESPRHRASIRLADGRVDTLTDMVTKQPIDQLEFAPEPLAVGGTRTALEATGERVPTICRDAVLAAEDRYFFHHPGVNPVAITRALVTNLRRGAVTQGGSTITQQLAKNTFLSPTRSYGRKLREAVLAILLELRTSKEEILHRYLASVYLGTDGGVPIHGLAQGAQVHLGKPLRDLDVGECALLAGMIQAPNRLTPRKRPEAARVRRNQVLELMAEAGLLAPTAALTAIMSPVEPAPPGTRPVGALYVADHVQRELAHLLGDDVIRSPGLTVFTSVDLDTQHDAEEAVRDGLASLEKGYQHLASGSLQAALVALDPSTGHIRALVGGRDYRASQLDRVARMRRQPGSTFKPFVYLTALDPERSASVGPRTVASMVEDAPFRMHVNGKPWTPANWDGQYHGVVTLSDALAGSMNTATVRLALTVGLDAVIATARDFGLGDDYQRVPALALGAIETSLLELTSAYGAIANGGVHQAPRLIVSVTSADGELLYKDSPARRHVTSAGVAYLATYMLSQVVERGTGRGVRRYVRGAVAGKTGTTNKTRDAWFVGFTPDILAGVWVGRDDGKRVGLGGSSAALPLWGDFMGRVEKRYVPRDFPIPPDVRWHLVDPTTGHLATAACAERRRMPFLQNNGPRQRCSAHEPEIIEATRRRDPREERRRRRQGGSGFGRWLRDLFD